MPVLAVSVPVPAEVGRPAPGPALLLTRWLNDEAEALDLLVVHLLDCVFGVVVVLELLSGGGCTMKV